MCVDRHLTLPSTARSGGGEIDAGDGTDSRLRHMAAVDACSSASAKSRRPSPSPAPPSTASCEQVGVLGLRSALGKELAAARPGTAASSRALRAAASSFSICCARGRWRVVDLQDTLSSRSTFSGAKQVDADRPAAGDRNRCAPACLRRRLLDALLRQPLLDRLRHPAERFDLVRYASRRAPGEVGGQALDIVGAAPGVDHTIDAALLDGGIAASRERCGRRTAVGSAEGLVERVGVQRLRMAPCVAAIASICRCARYCCRRVLRGQRPARGLAVRP